MSAFLAAIIGVVVGGALAFVSEWFQRDYGAKREVLEEAVEPVHGNSTRRCRRTQGRV